TTRHIPGVVDPLDAPSDWYVLAELASSRGDEPLEAILEKTLAHASESGWVTNATLAMNERERQSLWRLRESIPEAQRKDGSSSSGTRIRSSSTSCGGSSTRSIPTTS